MVRDLLRLFLLMGATALFNQTQAQVTASFIVSNSHVCHGQSIQFTSTSTNATQLQWDFGDWFNPDDTSSALQPDYTYSTSGIFLVTLIASNGTDQDTMVKAVVIEAAPDAAIAPPFSSICAGVEATFTSFMNGYRKRWYFGDGDSAVGDFVRHAYAVDGTYMIYQYSDGLCGQTAVDSLEVIVGTGPCPMGVSFFTDPVVCKGGIVQLNADALIDPIDSVRWEFSDGFVARTRNYNRIMNQTGNYTITLRAWRGTQTNSTSQVVQVREDIPDFGFVTANPGGVRLVNGIIEFNFVGEGIPVKWTFGDGTQLDNPQGKTANHQYANPGNYQVKCHFVSRCGNVPDSTLTSVTINNTVRPSVFASGVGTVCPNTEVYLNGFGMDTAGFTWFYGNDSTRGVIFNRILPLGLNVVKYRINHPLGGFFWDSVLVDVDNDVPAFANLNITPTQVCIGSAINYTITGADQVLEIDFGDGQTGTQASGQHVYASPGLYPVLIKVKNKCGNIGYNTEQVMVKPSGKDLNFAIWVDVPNSRTCVGDSFIIYSNAYADSVTFLLDNGQVKGYSPQGGKFPQHAFTQQGQHIIKAVKNSGCSSDTFSVVIDAFGPPQADFNLSTAGPFETGDPIGFNNLSTSAITYEWDFGDGTISKMINPSKVYNVPGTHVVTLKAYSDAGCTAEDTMHVTVTGTPIGYSQEQLESSLKVYPNPSTGMITVRSALLNGSEWLTLTDLSGRLILKQQADAGGESVLQLNQTGIAAGVYLLQIGDERVNTVRKIVYQP